MARNPIHGQRHFEPPEICPACGAEVPREARACPVCGADEHTGWSDRADAQRLGIPDGEFDYDEFLENEFGEGQEHPLRARGISWLWWVVALLVAAAFLAMYW